MKKIKTNHPFSKSQLIALNDELQKISNVKIVGLRGRAIPSKENYTDIEILHSPFNLSVFLSFIDITIPTQPKSQVYGIDTKGNVDYKVRSTMSFKNISDRVHFFNTLIPVEFSE